MNENGQLINENGEVIPDADVADLGGPAAADTPERVLDQAIQVIPDEDLVFQKDDGTFLDIPPIEVVGSSTLMTRLLGLISRNLLTRKVAPSLKRPWCRIPMVLSR